MYMKHVTTAITFTLHTFPIPNYLYQSSVNTVFLYPESHLSIQPSSRPQSPLHQNTNPIILTTMAPKRHAASTSSASAHSTTTTTTSKLSSGPTTLKTNASTTDLALHVWDQYLTTTPQRTLLLDAFMAFLVLVGGLQFLYCILVGNYVRRSRITFIPHVMGPRVLGKEND